jgi:hypothetical protein
MCDAPYRVCIDDLIGPRAREKGCQCPCPMHSPQIPDEEKANAEFSAVSAPAPKAEPPSVPRKPHDGKMAAANDQEKTDDRQ